MPRAQRLLLLRYSHTNQNNDNNESSSANQPFFESQGRGLCFQASMDSLPKALPRSFNLKQLMQYQSMVEENSIDSDGSNMTSITATTTGD
jgi:hypothetical protein